MIILIVLAWLGLLALLVKLRVFKGWSIWMKVSPVVVFLLGEVLLLLPMGYDAPSGPALVMNNSVQVTPSVSGIVTRVPVESGMPLKKEDVLFEIEPLIYQTEVNRLKARLELAKQGVERQQKIAEINAAATSEADAQKVAAEFVQATAELDAAEWRLGQTSVRAPFDGYVTSVLLRPGARVTADSEPVMSFVEESWQEVVVQIDQINLRNVEVGHPAEIIFKLFPGQVFEGKVQKIMSSQASGTLAPSGLAPESIEIHALPFWVVIEMDDESVELPPGAVGSVAIYTSSSPSVLFRKLSLRMENWLNFVFP